jgi:hypothetical protein
VVARGRLTSERRWWHHVICGMTWFFEEIVTVSQPDSAKPVEICLRHVYRLGDTKSLAFPNDLVKCEM